jgi:hypothetical protein
MDMQSNRKSHWMGDVFPQKFAGKFLFGFVIIFIISWLVLQFWNPKFVQRKDNLGVRTGEVDLTMVILISIGVAFILNYVLCVSKTWMWF